MSNPKIQEPAEVRATARVDLATKERMQAVITKFPALDESAIIRMGLDLVLPKLESGKLPRSKKAA